jgi:type IV pilus assembly protein PilB
MTTAVSNPVLTNDHGQIVSILIKEGLLSQEQLVYALRISSKLELPRPLVDILKELRYVTDDQIRSAIRSNRLNIRFGKLLEELGYITATELQQVFQIQKEEGHKRKIGEILVSKRFISERQMVEVLSLQMGFPFLEVEFIQIDGALFAKAPIRWYEQHRFVPVRFEDHSVVVAFADPLDPAALEAAKQSFGERVTPAIALEKSIQVVIKRFATRGKNLNSKEIDDGSVVGIVNTIIANAAQVNASDIHIEPMKDRLRIRFRRDGVLEHFKDLPEQITPPLVSRIKVMCGADIVEKRRHQGGRLVFDNNGIELDLRVSFYVTIYGEKVVMRLLNRQGSLIALDELGMYSRVKERFVQDALELPSGVILVTGPTGSGKTSTVYSCINHINRPETSIITAEEPVEYIIEGISQCSINPKINLTYDETLRHIVRQDPDVIVIGEIRDNFSAEIAVQSALTGHKVLTTFHTEDSIGGLIRLLNMEIEAFLISSTVVSVLAQRLLRRVCIHCALPTKPTSMVLQRLGYTLAELAEGKFMKGRGCPKCNHTGYHGRIAVFELLILDEMVRNAILDRRTSHEIRQISIENSGLVTLLEDGIAKAGDGITTLEEVLRCLPRLNKPRPLAEIRRSVGAN